MKLVRFHDLVIHHEHQREVDPKASGRCLAEAHRKGWFELPLFNHEVKQFMARVNLVGAVMPELEFPPTETAIVPAFLARAIEGLTLAKEAQATPLREIFLQQLAGNDWAGWTNWPREQSLGPMGGSSSCSMPRKRATRMASRTHRSCK